MSQDPLVVLCHPGRLDALRRYALLDRPALPALDRLTRLASRMLKVPMAFVTLVEQERQFFASAQGLPEPTATTRQTPLSHSFCQHVVATAEPLIISDARQHPLMCNNLAIPDLGVIAYAGIPLITSDGYTLGSFCAIDTRPRSWQPDEIETLRDLAACTMTELELRSELVSSAQLQRATSLRFRRVSDLLGQGLVMTDLDGELLYANPRFCELVAGAGERPERPVAHMLPLPGGWPDAQFWGRNRRPGGSHVTRLAQPDGTDRWVDVSLSPLQTDTDEIVGTIALVSDIDERVRAEAALRASEERLRALSAQLLQAQEAERRTIARELHDEIGQGLTALQLNLQAAEYATAPALSAPLEESIGLVDQILAQVRDLSLDLHPSLLDDLGLEAALEWYVGRQAARAGFAASVDVAMGNRRLPPTIEVACFRIVQEAVNNIARYAGARAVRVALWTNDDRLCLEVEDDGRGFDVAAARQRALHGRSLGLLGMRERALLLGGELAIRSDPGQGTTISAHLPLVAADGEEGGRP